VIDQAHRVVGHRAARKTRDYISRWFGWPTLAKDVEHFRKTCGICQVSMTSTSKPKDLLHSLPIPGAPWQSISMDFVGPFPECMGYDCLLVVICRLISLVHLIPTATTVKATEVAWLFLKDMSDYMGYQNPLYRTVTLSSYLSSGANSIASWVLSYSCPQLITPRRMRSGSAPSGE